MSILYAFTGKIISDDTQSNTCAPLSDAADSLIVQSINTDDIRDLTKKNMDTAGTYTKQDYYLLDTQPDTLLWNEPLKVTTTFTVTEVFRSNYTGVAHLIGAGSIELKANTGDTIVSDEHIIEVSVDAEKAAQDRCHPNSELIGETLTFSAALRAVV